MTTRPKAPPRPRRPKGPSPDALRGAIAKIEEHGRFQVAALAENLATAGLRQLVPFTGDARPGRITLHGIEAEGAHLAEALDRWARAARRALLAMGV